MAYLTLAVFLLVVITLTVASMKKRRPIQSCCAPADPANDLRMRAAFDDDGHTRSR